jgi:hypothetical protein
MQAADDAGESEAIEESHGEPPVSSSRSIDKASVTMYANMPPLMINNYVDGLKLFANYIITIGTCFSGIEIAGIGIDSIRYAALYLWGVPLKFHYAFMCENDVAKQEFLLETNPDADMLIDNSKELDKTFTRNKRDNMRVVSIPAVFMFIAGFM